ncbi:MAG: hypothetical protein ACLFQP_09695 [Halothece sp.]
MLVIYIACSLIGGIFVLLSVSGGFEGFDAEADADADVDMDADADMDGEALDDVDFGTQPETKQARFSSRKKRWLPFYSFKFWTFGVCFFGLTGLALTLLEPNLGQGIIGAIALAMGLVIGTAMAWLLRILGGNYTNSITRTEDLVGAVGTVEIPFNTNSRGKVQLPLKGSTVAFSAMTEEEAEFQPGDQILVVSFSDNKVWVVSAKALQEEN